MATGSYTSFFVILPICLQKLHVSLSFGSATVTVPMLFSLIRIQTALESKVLLFVSRSGQINIAFLLETDIYNFLARR